MKVKELNPATKEFKPIELVLTIESKRELEFLWLLFNASESKLAALLCNVSHYNHEISEFDSLELRGFGKDRIWNILEEKMKQL